MGRIKGTNRVGARQSKDVCLPAGKVENLVAVQSTKLDAIVCPIWHQQPGRYLAGALVPGPLWKAKLVRVWQQHQDGYRQVCTFSCNLLIPRLLEVVPAAQLEDKPSPTSYLIWNWIFPRYSKSSQLTRPPYMLKAFFFFWGRILLCSLNLLGTHSVALTVLEHTDLPVSAFQVLGSRHAQYPTLGFFFLFLT